MPYRQNTIYSDRQTDRHLFKKKTNEKRKLKLGLKLAFSHAIK